MVMSKTIQRSPSVVEINTRLHRLWAGVMVPDDLEEDN